MFAPLRIDEATYEEPVIVHDQRPSVVDAAGKVDRLKYPVAQQNAVEPHSVRIDAEMSPRSLMSRTPVEEPADHTQRARALPWLSVTPCAWREDTNG